MLSRLKIHSIMKELFKRVKDIDKVMIFAYKENGKWKIAFSEDNVGVTPSGTINLWFQFRTGYLNNSPSKATEEIVEELKKYI